MLRGHEDEVRSSTAVSHTGRWIATTVKDNAVQLWDTKAKDQAGFSQRLRGPEAIITTLQMSSNDRWLAAGCKNNTAYIWDLNNQDVSSSMKAWESSATADMSSHEHVGRLTIGPNGHRLALAGGDYRVRLWDLASDDPEAEVQLLSGHDSVIRSMVISRDGRWLATGAEKFEGETAVRLWDLESSDIQASSRELHGHTGDVYSLAIDDSSRWLATAGGGTVRIWDLSADPSVAPREILPPPRPARIHLANGHESRW